VTNTVFLFQSAHCLMRNSNLLNRQPQEAGGRMPR
jgi:hypothetical protein